MTLEMMQEFVILTEERNFLVAADKLFSTQATLSRHIKSMEEELGFLLFNRSTKKIELTSEGSRFLLYARRAVRLTDGYKAALALAQRSMAETLHVGYNALVTFYHFTEVLTRFMTVSPDIPVKIIEGTAEQLIASVADGDCDIVFIQEDPFHPPEGLDVVHIASDKAAAVLPSGHPLSGRESIALSELSGESFVTSVENQAPATVFLNACRKIGGFEPKVTHTGLVGPALFDWIGGQSCVGLEWRIPGLSHANDRTALVNIEPELRSYTSIVYRAESLSDNGRKLITFFRDNLKGAEAVR